MRSYYEILGIERTADIKEIKGAYAKLLRKYPPETCPNEFKEIRKAYEVLLKEKSRAKNDKRLAPVSVSTVKHQMSKEETEFVLWEQFEEEEETEKKVTPETDFNEIKRQLNIHYKNNDYQKVLEVLDAAIDKENPRSSKNILYYIEMIEVMITAGRYTDFTYAVSKIFESMKLKKEEEVTKYIFKQLMSVISSLYIEKKFSYCGVLIESMREVDPYNTDIQKFANALKNIEECRAKLAELKNNNSIEHCLKELITLWLNEFKDISERKKALEDIEKQIDNMNRATLLRSLDKLRKNYNMFYRIDTQYFNNLYHYLGKNITTTNKQQSYTGGSTYIIVVIVLIALRFFISTASRDGSSYDSLKNIPDFSRMNSRVLNVQLPTRLPEGYVLQNAVVQYDKDSPITELSEESFGTTMDSLKIERNVQYVKLTFVKDKTIIYFEADADGDGMKANADENIEVGSNKIGYSAFKDDGKELKLILYRASMQNFDPNKKNADVFDKWIDYTISTSSTGNGASKEELIFIAEGLSFITHAPEVQNLQVNE